MGHDIQGKGVVMRLMLRDCEMITERLLEPRGAEKSSSLRVQS